jgi:hypothetical protein
VSPERHEHVLCSAPRRALRTIAGAERHFLNGDLHAVERAGSRRRCDHDDRVGTELPRRLEHPVNHATPQERMQVLRDV